MPLQDSSYHFYSCLNLKGSIKFVWRMGVAGISITNNLSPNEIILGCPIYTVTNVIKIENNQPTGIQSERFGYNVLFEETDLLQGEPAYYFYFDGIYSDAFGHWIFESAVVLFLWRELKKKYPSLKILTNLRRSYKDSVYRAFDIPEEDITYTMEKKNKVLFTRYLSFFDPTMNEAKYGVYLDEFYKALTQGREVQKDISILYLPRGRLENYKGNDRIIENQHEIEELVRSYPGSQVYFTDQTKDMRNQIDMVRRARIVICDYGSNFSFNSFFCENAFILTLGQDNAHTLFEMSRTIYNRILWRKNEVIQLPRQNQRNVGISTFSFSIQMICEKIKEAQSKGYTI